MKINVPHPDPALIRIIEDPDQIITLDANFLIAPDRRPIAKRGISFEQFREIWLDPIFSIFPNLAIHESVYDELIGISPQHYVDTKRDITPPEIIIHKDSLLTEVEKILRDTIQSRIASHTKYEPLLDNKDDRGEVKSLSYIAVKGLLYFAANDNSAIQLVEKSEVWSTGLGNVQAIKIYELIYYLFRNDLADKTAMKMLYKYQYYLTEREKSTNPGWGDFYSIMDNFYESYFRQKNPLREDNCYLSTQWVLLLLLTSHDCNRRIPPVI